MNKLMNNKMQKAAAVLTAAFIVSTAGLSAANAQAPAGQPGGSGPGGPVAAVMCVTTNSADVAAKALGMDSLALRKALAGGQTLAQVASSQKVSLQVVQDALKAAYEGDLQQAVKDGLLSQQAYDQMKTRLDQPQQNAAPQATPPDGGQNGNPQGPRGRFVNVSVYTPVNLLDTASKTLDMPCVDLAKAVQGGQTIAQVATSKNIQAQVVIDALLNAEKTALAKDVTDAVISQDQADTRSTDLTTRLTAYVNNTQQPGRGGFGQGRPAGGGPGNPPDGNNPQGGAPGNPPPVPSNNG